MIYLRHAFAASGLAVPKTVDIVVDDIAVDDIVVDDLEWLVAQVRSEMQALFPDAQVRVSPPPVGPGGHEHARPDLLVVVYAARTRPEERLARLGRRARDARIGVALYCFDDRRFELVPAGDLERWTKEQRRRRIVLSWSRRLPAVWNRVVRRLVAS
jgi:hypothetical protein